MALSAIEGSSGSLQLQVALLSKSNDMHGSNALQLIKSVTEGVNLTAPRGQQVRISA
ncbi:MAG: hypothetical protein HRT89_24395 [Lentisphaeria bacterium]|nr:hypothetical protein [Lentisphaeria bacterium]NQZ71198.1 hypothetical protein [Lentisphaeria bacterium]